MGRAVEYAQWLSRDAFEAMLANPEAQQHMQPISEYAQHQPHLYEVVGVQHV
jgi:hypothetical protein